MYIYTYRDAYHTYQDLFQTHGPLTQWSFPPEKSPFSHSAPLEGCFFLGFLLRHLVLPGPKTIQLQQLPHDLTEKSFNSTPPKKNKSPSPIPPSKKYHWPKVHHPLAAVLNHHVSLATRLQPLVLRPSAQHGWRFECEIFRRILIDWNLEFHHEWYIFYIF